MKIIRACGRTLKLLSLAAIPTTVIDEQRTHPATTRPQRGRKDYSRDWQDHVGDLHAVPVGLSGLHLDRILQESVGAFALSAQAFSAGHHCV